MEFTKHAIARKNQRGFSNFTLDIILKHGCYQQSKECAIKVYFGNKQYQKIVGELKRAIQLMDKAKNSSMIIINNHVITAYKNYWIGEKNAQE